MARKGKIGIDYFSHDVDILQDKKIKLIKAKHGLIGYAIYLRLLEEIYRDTGYYLQLDENFNILFSDDNKIELNEYILILNNCINIDLFNKKIYGKYNIITSKRIQLNYFSGTERRKEVEFIKEYLIVDPMLNYNTDRVNVNIISLNADINTQSKVKEKKEKETKEEFEKFWSLYQKKIDRDKCYAKWLKLNQKEKDSIFNCVSKYVQATPDKQYRKNPLTWLNGKCWEDDITIQEQPKATNYADDILKAIQTNGSYSTPNFTDPKLKKIVSAIGWGNLCKMSPKDIQYKLKGFI